MTVQYVATLQLNLDSGIRRYAFDYVSLNDGTEFFGKLRAVSNIHREVPLLCGLYSVGEVEVELDNTDREFSILRATEAWRNRAAIVSLIVNNGVAGAATARAFTGVISNWELRQNKTFIKLKDISLDRFNVPVTKYMSQATLDIFPNLPGYMPPHLVPVIWGDVKGHRGDGDEFFRAPLPGYIIDATTSPPKYVLANQQQLTVESVYVYGRLLNPTDYDIEATAGGEVVGDDDFNQADGALDAGLWEGSGIEVLSNEIATVTSFSAAVSWLAANLLTITSLKLTFKSDTHMRQAIGGTPPNDGNFIGNQFFGLVVAFANLSIGFEYRHNHPTVNAAYDKTIVAILNPGSGIAGMGISVFDEVILTLSPNDDLEIEIVDDDPNWHFICKVNGATQIEFDVDQLTAGAFQSGGINSYNDNGYDAGEQISYTLWDDFQIHYLSDLLGQTFLTPHFELRDPARTNENELTYSARGFDIDCFIEQIQDFLTLYGGVSNGELGETWATLAEYLCVTRSPAYFTGWAITDRTKTIEAILREALESAMLTLWADRDGLLQIAFADQPVGSPPNIVATYTDAIEVVRDSARFLGPADAASSVQYDFNKNYAANNFDDTDREEDAGEIAAQGQDNHKPKSLWYMRNPPDGVPLDVAQVFLHQGKEGLQFVFFEVPIETFAAIDVNSFVYLTHREGPSADGLGYQQKVVRILVTDTNIQPASTKIAVFGIARDV